MRWTMCLVLFLHAACSETAEKAPVAQQPAVKPATDPATARKLIAEGAVVLDVRTAEEFEDAHVPTAVNVPVLDVSNRLAEVERLVGGDRSRPVVVYCGSGARSATAKLTLEAAGFTQVVNGGGYKHLN